jgi:hypothetical protein
MFLGQIIEALTIGGAIPPAVDSLIEGHVCKLRIAFDDLLWTSKADHPNTVRDITRSYEQIAGRDGYPFFLSPEAYRSIRDDGTPIAKRLATIADLLSAELQIRDAADLDVRKPARLPNGQEYKWGLMARHALVDDGGEQHLYVAPLADGFIPVDFLSPWATAIDAESATMDAPPRFPDESVVEVAAEKVSWALRELDQHAAAFGRIARNYTRVVRVRLQPSTESASETVPIEIGAVRFLNPHLDAFDEIGVRDALVHESVHHFLSTDEFVESEFILQESDNRFRPISPWSGYPIPLKSFCHAIFVYYSLFNLTLHDLNRSDLDRSMRMKAYKRRNHYASAFMGPPIVDYIYNKPIVKKEVLAAIAVMQENVKHKMA